MSGRNFDQIEQAQRAGIGLVAGGLAFGGLSLSVDALVSGALLVAAGLAVWLLERRRDVTVGMGVGIGLAGASILFEVVTGGGSNELRLAGSIAAFGVVDFLLVPLFARL